MITDMETNESYVLDFDEILDANQNAFGQIFNFRTTVGDNQTNGGVVIAWFRKKIN